MAEKSNRHHQILINFLLLLIVSISLSTAAQISWTREGVSENQESAMKEIDHDRRTVSSKRHLQISHNSHRSHLKSADDGGGDNPNNNNNNDDDDDDDNDYKRFLPSWVGNENFILTDYLTDGELERRISYNGITAKETSIGYNSSDLLSLWQVSDGKRFIQLIYSNGRDLIDCEYVRQMGLVRKFLHDFYIEIDVARSRNFTWRPIKTTIDDENFVHEDDEFNGMPMTPAFGGEAMDAFGMRNLSYQRIERFDDIPVEIRQWLNYNELKLLCFKRHEQMKTIMKGLNSQDEDVRRDANQSIKRQKRDLSDWLIAPNTKWCGKGHNAGKYNQLGGASTADKCCRKHDHCKLNIPGLTTKWQVFNYFPFTISHCSCDMRFRTCLKMADSSDANMVGKLFFNIVQTKCFVLKSEKVCKKRSWWGKCEKRIRRKRAHLRDNRKF